jgi:Family of unknown function (DUF6498)
VRTFVPANNGSITERMDTKFGSFYQIDQMASTWVIVALGALMPVNWLARLSLLVGLNAVPVVGVARVGWTNATALVLYWGETVILVRLVALRIRLHRRWTNKRGHYGEMLVKITRNGLSRTERSIGYFGTSFIAFALMFSTAQAVFLKFILRKTSLLGHSKFYATNAGIGSNRRISVSWICR